MKLRNPHWQIKTEAATNSGISPPWWEPHQCMESEGDES